MSDSCESSLAIVLREVVMQLVGVKLPPIVKNHHSRYVKSSDYIFLYEPVYCTNHDVWHGFSFYSLVKIVNHDKKALVLHGIWNGLRISIPLWRKRKGRLVVSCLERYDYNCCASHIGATGPSWISPKILWSSTEIAHWSKGWANERLYRISSKRMNHSALFKTYLASASST